MKKVYIIHGWSYSIDKYQKLSELLETKGLKTFLLKVPGLTEKMNTDKIWGIEDYVKWLKGILDQEKDPASPQGGKVILIGHSNGGRIALNFALKYPQKLHKLVLIDSAGIYHNELPIRAKRIIFSALAKIGKKLTSSEDLKNLLYRLTGERDYKNASTQMGKVMNNLIKSDASLNLSKITIPTLIIWGDEDKVLSLQDGEKMQKQIKNSKLKIVQGARHSPQFTNPEEVAEIIYGYI